MKQSNRSTTKKFAVFDIDGTLIRWQLYHAVVDELAKAGHIPEHVYREVRKKRMAWKTRDFHDAFKQYEKAIVQSYEDALPKLRTDVFDALAEKVAQKYSSQVYTYTRELIDKLKHQNYMILAISGSHEELLRHVAPKYGFDDWVGSTYHRKAEGFSGEKFIASFNKAETLRKLIKKHDLSTTDSYGIGDSKSDASFLELVEHPIAFNPDSSLLAIARDNNWKIIVERKNVIYSIDELGSKSPRIETFASGK